MQLAGAAVGPVRSVDTHSNILQFCRPAIIPIRDGNVAVVKPGYRGVLLCLAGMRTDEDWTACRIPQLIDEAQNGIDVSARNFELEHDRSTAVRPRRAVLKDLVERGIL